MRRHLRIAAGGLSVAGVIGLLFASPEFVRIVQLPDGSATAVPRIPWAAALAELAVAVGLGLFIVTLFLKKPMRKEPNHASDRIVNPGGLPNGQG